MSLLLLLLGRRPRRLCFCGRPVRAVGLCARHYAAWYAWRGWHSAAHGVPVPGGTWYPACPPALLHARLTADAARRDRTVGA
jgi:hypothetical protein